MPNSSLKSTLVGGVVFAFVLGALAYQYSTLRELQDSASLSEDRLRLVEKNAGKVVDRATPVATATSPASEHLAELEALRADVTKLRQQLDTLSRAGGRNPSMAIAESTVAPGETGPFSPESVAAIRKLVDDTLQEREEARRADRVVESQERMQERRKRTLDEMEKRLQLSAFQREQIDLALQEQTKAVAAFTAAAEAGDGGRESMSRDERRKQWQDLESATETKVKTVLTPAQVTEYDAWKQETGGLNGGGGRAFGGRGGRGGTSGGGNDGAGGGRPTPTGGGAGS